MSSHVESSVVPERQGVVAAAGRAYRGELPERYRGYPASFRVPFERAVTNFLVPDIDVLDVGGGRTATIAPPERPPGCRYVGLDVSPEELDRAPAGSYDETVVADITQECPALEGRFDLIVSFQALEHVRGLDRAFATMLGCLRPGGHLVAQLSGTFSVYGLISRVTPHRVARWLQHRLYQREPDTVFRPIYDRCYFSALQRMTREWSSAEITPLWMALPYFRFSRLLASGYFAYEEWARQGGRNNLAPYYLVVARR